MKSDVRFDGRVALVTGAGGGLGRAHALLLASRGAKVVVNDLGGSATGSGASASAADRVVAEIREAGGEAVADYNSVENGAAIVKTAIDAFGRIDIVVNNAGILRDKSFHKMTDEDWQIVHRVHLYGSFAVTHAAWPYLREQSYGRVIMTASAAGIYGNFGQANYGAAKLGLAGFANTLALEGVGRNIQVNTIAPIAGSRLTETVMPEELVKALAPEYVSPLVAWLCHENCAETGGLFEVGGGYFGKLRWERAAGKLVRMGRAITVETVRESWGAITSFDDATHPATTAESLQPIISNASAGPSKGGNQFIDVDLALGYELPPVETSYDQRDLALYGLAVGAGDDPTDEVDLQYVYELHGDGFKPLATYGVVPALNAFFDLAKQGIMAPGLSFGLDRILHGEQRLELLRPLPLKAKLTNRIKVASIADKGKHALITFEITSSDETGEPILKNEVVAVIRGAGGWGGDRGPSGEANEPPARAPDVTVEQRVSQSQALLYRLNGDWNPLHADPNFAKAMGFEKPILHGLCTFGYAGRHVVREFAGGDPRMLRKIEARMAASVFPGETLIIQMWRESPTRIVLSAKVKERDAVVLSNAAVELFESLPKAPVKKVEVVAAPAVEAAPASADVFVAIRDHIERNPELVAGIQNVFRFELKDPDSAWTLDLKNAPGSVIAGAESKADCTLALTDADFLAMTNGTADPQQLFMKGKLKISGNLMASQKLEFLKKIDPERAKAAVIAARKGGTAPAAVKAAAAAPSLRAAPKIFEALSARIAKTPALVSEFGAIVGVRIASPESVIGADAVPIAAEAQWTVDLKTAPGGVKRGVVSAADAVLTLEEEDLVGLAKGETDARDLYQRGRLRVDGDVRVAQRLGFLKQLA